MALGLKRMEQVHLVVSKFILLVKQQICFKFGFKGNNRIRMTDVSKEIHQNGVTVERRQ